MVTASSVAGVVPVESPLETGESVETLDVTSTYLLGLLVVNRRQSLVVGRLVGVGRFSVGRLGCSVVG